MRPVLSKLEEIEGRILEKEPAKFQAAEEEAVLEDVLIITTDKSLVDELEPSEADRFGDRKKVDNRKDRREQEDVERDLNKEQDKERERDKALVKEVCLLLS